MSLSPGLTRLAIGMTGRRRLLLLTMLVLLYLVLLQGPTEALARTLFVVHLGLFILWQPFVRAEQRLSVPGLLFVASLVVAAAFWLNGWMIALWMAVLAGTVGGKVFLYEARWSRLYYLLALGYLVTAFLLVALPAALPGERGAGPAVAMLARWLPPALFLAMAVLPEKAETEGQAETVDFVYSVVVVLLLAVVGLGSVAVMLLVGHGYGEALLESLLGVGLVLLALGWVWNPRAGIAGIGTLFSRYLLSIGLPVERWLHALADLAERQEDPEVFVAEACEEMVRRLPWVTGGDWASTTGSGSFGHPAGRRSEFRFEALSVAIHTRYALSPSLVWHLSLLAQLISDFYADLRRARQLKCLSYEQAIHETGARLTHDLKNLLQTLRTLCSAAGSEGDEVSPAFVSLLRRQLPAITSRLTQTLGKLQSPHTANGEHVTVNGWWAELRRRYAGAPVRFIADEALPAATVIPSGLFDHAADNLLANALEKGRGAGDFAVEVQLRLGAGGAELTVCDSGAPVPDVVMAHLLQEPVPSESGLGIGLYQVARLAGLSGFALTLAENRPGRVCFRLAAR